MGFEHISSGNTYASGIEEEVEKHKYRCVGEIKIRVGSKVEVSKVLGSDVIDENMASNVLGLDVLDKNMYGVSGTIQVNDVIEAWSKSHARYKWRIVMKSKDMKLTDAIKEKHKHADIHRVSDTLRVYCRVSE
jgi:hypothetical protein